MPAPVDSNKSYLIAAYPLNSEWKYTDAAPYICNNGATGNPLGSAGNTNITTAQYKYYAESAYFDGVGDTLKTSGTVSLNGDFTMECWIRWSGGSNAEGSDHIFLSVRDGNSNGIALFRNISNGKLALYMGATAGSIDGATTINANTWYHVAVTRASGTVKLWVNGVQDYTGVPSSFAVGTRKITIGGRWDDAYCFNGYIQDVRIYDGKAIYTSTFTPPTQIVDYSGSTTGIHQNVYAIPFNQNYGLADASSQIRGWGTNCEGSAVNDVTIQTGGPTKFYGYSGYFDGTEDHIYLWGLNGTYIGRNDFTVEAWVYHTGSADDTILSDGSSFSFNYGASGKLRFYTGAGANLVDASSNYISNQWVHIAVVRNAGTLTFYQNGTAVGSHSYANEIGACAGMHLGKYYNGTTQGWQGYINDLRIYNGFAKYTSNFTPSSTAMATTPSATVRDGMELIKTITVTGTQDSGIEFTGIPQDYKNLYVHVNGKTNYGTGYVDTITMRINNTVTGYSSMVMYGEGNGMGAFAYAPTSVGHFGYCGASYSSAYNDYNYGSIEATFPNYTSSAYKTYQLVAHHVTDHATPATNQAGVQGLVAGHFTNSSPIRSITIFATGSWQQGSTFQLYGAKG
jgi:hypothetical protein